MLPSTLHSSECLPCVYYRNMYVGVASTLSMSVVAPNYGLLSVHTIPSDMSTFAASHTHVLVAHVYMYMCIFCV